MDLLKQLQSELGLPDSVLPRSAGVDQPGSELRTFLTFNPKPGKVDFVPGEIKIELCGAMWKVQLISHCCWRKKTFYTQDLTNLVADCETALADGRIPLERAKSKRQSKNPDQAKGDSA